MDFYEFSQCSLFRVGSGNVFDFSWHGKNGVKLTFLQITLGHSCFESLLERNNSVSLHQRNLQLLLVEILKTKENLNPSFMKDVLVERTENYNLRSGNTLQLPKARTTTYGIESVSFPGSLFWHALPEGLKKSENLTVFKRELRSWKGLDCKCRLCKMYIADLGYL